MSASGNAKLTRFTQSHSMKSPEADAVISSLCTWARSVAGVCGKDAADIVLVAACVMTGACQLLRYRTAFRSEGSEGSTPPMSNAAQYIPYAHSTPYTSTPL